MKQKKHKTTTHKEKIPKKWFSQTNDLTQTGTLTPLEKEKVHFVVPDPERIEKEHKN